MRLLKKLSTARCGLMMYISFLLSEPRYPNCQRLSEVMEISHDSVNRFLLREDYKPEDMFNEAKKYIEVEGGVLSVDDTVLDKPYMNIKANSLLGVFWSGKHHRIVKGINLLTLHYTDKNGMQVPVNYRIYDKSENKTKNTYFLEMLDEVLAWGLKPLIITGDAWYSALKNLKHLKNAEIDFLFAIKSNRLISLSEANKAKQVQSLDIPEEGLQAYLKGIGHVVIFKTKLKDEFRYFVSYRSIQRESHPISRMEFYKIHDAHWNIEEYHRAIKQECQIERFQVRNEIAIKNHIFCALAAFIQLEFIRSKNQIDNWYKLRRELFNEMISQFIQSRNCLEGIPFGSGFSPLVNA